jgi:hypothetical protein
MQDHDHRCPFLIRLFACHCVREYRDLAVHDDWRQRQLDPMAAGDIPTMPRMTFQ